MTIGARLAWWYSGALVAVLLVLGGGLYYELVTERKATYQAGRPREPIREEVEEVVFFYAIPAIFVSVVSGWWLVRRVLAPVRQLTAAAERISARSLTERLPRTGNGDELDRLTEVFNEMLGRLHNSFDREREFTLHASHELKTPLTILRGEIETALREDPLTPRHRDLLAGQLDEIQRLTAIVDSLSLLAKADAGQVELRRERVRFDELVQDAFADAQLLGNAANCHVTLEFSEAVEIVGDRHRLRQLLLVLTDNALKFNRTGGRVSFALARRKGQAELVVINTGPGIPPEKIDRVFDRFFRGDPAHNSSLEGSGLGLSIAQWIVRAHEGTIELTSRIDAETTVRVRLPVAPS